MRFVRTLAGMLLLTIGSPALLAGGALGMLTRQGDPGGTFRTRLETEQAPGHAMVVADLELRAGWVVPATWSLLAGGTLLVALAVPLLLRPVRPREVVFVVEPDQVPVLAGRLGVTSLSGLGAQPAPDRARSLGERQLVSVGAAAGSSRRAIGPAPADAPLALVRPPTNPEATAHPSGD